MFLVICLIIDDPLVMVYFLVNKIKGPASHSLSFNWFEFSSSLVTKVKFLSFPDLYSGCCEEMN